MTDRELERCRARLEQFMTELFALLGHEHRSFWASMYLQGLLLEGERKSIEPLAQRVPAARASGADAVQALQHFVNQSPWAWDPVRTQLALRMSAELDTEPVWVIDDTGFPKKGQDSVGVQRQYSGTLGKIGNCQVAPSLHLATDEASVPVHWALYLPESWTEDPDRRQRAGIPGELAFRPKWKIALELIDDVLHWGLAPHPVVADSAYGEVAEFRAGLERRQLLYAVGVASTTTVWVTGETLAAAGPRRGRPRHLPTLPVRQSVEQTARALPRPAWKKLTWREGSKGKLQSRFAAVRVQPGHGPRAYHADLPQCWLLIEWPAQQDKPTKYVFSNLPAQAALRRLVRLAKSRWRIEMDYQQLKEELGLDHFEGRSWQGWHHHVTLVTMAYAFLVLEQLRKKKNFWMDPPEDA